VEDSLVRSLRGLIVDNKTDNIEPIQQALTLALKKLGWLVDWTTETAAIAAQTIVNDSPLPFDFAIVDLFLYRDEIDDGLEVLKEITAKNSGTYRLLVTSYSRKAPGFHEDAARYCTHSIDRTALGRAPRWKFERLAQDILQHLSEVGLLEIAHTSYERHPRVIALLDDIGRASGAPRFQQEDDIDHTSERREAGLLIIRNLALRCIGEIYPTDVTLRIAYAPAGKSGAKVCRIELIKGDDPRQAFILKLSFDKRMLERECSANREACKALSPPDLIPLIGDVQSGTSGYHAIAARVASGTITLRDWLRQPDSNRAAADVANVLLGQLLAPLFAPDGRKWVASAKWLSPSSWDVDRASATINQYAAAIEDPRAVGRRSARHCLRPLQDFLKTGQYPLPDGVSLPSEVCYVRTWGDLHAGNILVPTGELPRPLLIDATLYGRGHWARDCARLIADLFLRDRKPGVDGMVWDSLKEALHFGYRLCPHSELIWEHPPSSAEIFVSQCVRDLVRYTCAMSLDILPDEWHWQWHAALAKEFLRQASYDDMPPPRAVLALLLAAGHMRLSMIFLRRAGKQQMPMPRA
jgi:hypothetical protein